MVERDSLWRPDSYEITQPLHVGDGKPASGEGVETEISLSYESNTSADTGVFYYPERDGVKIYTPGSPSAREGRQRALFGLVLIKLVWSDIIVVNEL